MVYLIGQIWPYLLAALLLGLAFGWWACRDSKCEGAYRPSGLAWLLAIAFIIAVIVAAKHVLLNEAGLWLDVALELIAAYILGCIGACVCCCWCNRCKESAAATTTLVDKQVAPAVQSPFTLKGAYDGHAVTLTGYVGSEDERRAIADSAKLALPRAQINNQLKLASGSPSGFASLAGYGLKQLGQFSRGTVSLTDKTLSVEGDVLTQAAYDSVMGALKALPSSGLLGAVAIKGPPAPVFPAPTAVVPASAPVVPAPAPEPVPAAPTQPIYEMDKVENEDAIAGQRPSSLKAPIGGKADDLKQIKGIGKQNEGRLHGLGIWHFSQIAQWSADNALWVGSFLAFPGRIEREEWIAQAKVLATGGKTEFAQRVERGEVATSKDDGSKGHRNIEAVDLSKGRGGTPPKH